MRLNLPPGYLDVKNYLNLRNSDKITLTKKKMEMILKSQKKKKKSMIMKKI